MKALVLASEAVIVVSEGGREDLLRDLRGVETFRVLSIDQE